MAEERCRIVVPFGYSPVYWGMETDEDGGNLARKLMAFAFEFMHVQFRVRELAKGFIEFKMIRTLSADSKITERFAGKIESAHRMQFGEVVVFDRVEGGRLYGSPEQLVVTFIKRK